MCRRQRTRRYFRSRNSTHPRARWPFLSPREWGGHKIFFCHLYESQMPRWLPPPQAFAAVLRLRNQDTSRPSERWCTETPAWSPTLPQDGSPGGPCWIAAPILPERRRDRESGTRDFLFVARTVQRVWQKQKKTRIRARKKVQLRSPYRHSAGTPRQSGTRLAQARPPRA